MRRNARPVSEKEENGKIKLPISCHKQSENTDVDDEPEIVEGLKVLIEAENPDYHIVGKALPHQAD